MAEVHVAEIDDAENLARLRPWRADQGVVIVGVAIDHAAAEVGKIRNGIGFEEIEKLFRESAALRIRDIGKIIAGPQGAGEIPLEFADCSGMRKIKECEIEFAKEAAERSKKLRRMRFGFSEGGARKKGEEPDEARGAVFEFEAGKELALLCGHDAGQSEMRCALSEVGECAARHSHEGFFAGRMHYLEDELAGAGSAKVKIVFIFAWERA